MGMTSKKEQRSNPFVPYHALRLMPWLVILLLFMPAYIGNGLTRLMEEQRSIESSIDPQETEKLSLQALNELPIGRLKETMFGAQRCSIPCFPFVILLKWSSVETGCLTGPSRFISAMYIWMENPCMNATVLKKFTSPKSGPKPSIPMIHC